MHLPANDPYNPGKPERPATTRFSVSRLTLYLLGQPRIERDGAPVVVDTRKAIALIAYVAVTHQPHSRDTLAALLWPEYDHIRAYANLRRTIWALNKALAGDYLDIDRDSIGLNPHADLWVDVDQFAALLARRRAHTHSEAEVCPACLELMAEAAALYRADFMHGFALADSPGFDEWQFFQAESMQRSFAQALEQLVQGYIAQGQLSAAIGYARRWVALDALHEPAHRVLMRLYAWSGQHSAALRQYRECARALEEAIGAGPQVATVALYESIKAQQLPPPPLHDPQSFSGDAIHPTAEPTPAPAHNLPAQPGPFVGRAEELAEVAALLSDPACRLLTLVGPGGIGKTRLAVQAAGNARDAFAHGVYFVPCSAASSPIALVSGLADALRFAFYEAGDPKRQLLDFLRPKQLLLVFDGAEYLDGAVELLTEILDAAPAVTLLATSTERLNLREEWMLEIQGLRFPEDDHDLEIDRYSAVRLFCQSARRAQASFAPAEADKPFIARICRLVAGMPLGIDLAASWLRVLSCQEIVHEVENNLDFLATSLRNVPERHRSLRAVFEHSWQMLAEQERQVLGRLAVFRGGFTLEAAETICTEGKRQKVKGKNVAENGALLPFTFSLLPLLAALVDKSLLRRITAGRYEMLDMIRQYAAEKLDEAARGEARARHCAYYVELLRRHGQALAGGQQLVALAEIRQELGNLRAGWAWAVEAGQPSEVQSFADDLYRFYELQSRFQEGEEQFRHVSERLRALDGAPAATNDLLLAWIDARQGGLCYRLGRNEQALQLLHAALAVFRAHHEDAEIAFCLTCLGDIERIKGQYHEARALLEESLAICARLDDRRTAARAYTNLGIVAGASGDYREAQRLFQESLAIFQAFGDRWGEAKALINQGIIAYYLREHAEAQRLLHASLTIARAIDNRYGVAMALNNLGIVTYEQGQYAEALRLHQESCAIFEQIGYQLGAGLTLNDVARVALVQGDQATARAYFEAALRTAVAIKATPLALDALVGIAMLSVAAEPERARELLDLAGRHPASGQETRERAAALLAELGALPAATLEGQPDSIFSKLVEQILARQEVTNI
jgi:predicted ATPase/DNA-binding SARP family transcriptional activator